MGTARVFQFSESSVGQTAAGHARAEETLGDALLRDRLIRPEDLVQSLSLKARRSRRRIAPLLGRGTAPETDLLAAPPRHFGDDTAEPRPPPRSVGPPGVQTPHPAPGAARLGHLALHPAQQSGGLLHHRRGRCRSRERRPAPAHHQCLLPSHRPRSAGEGRCRPRRSFLPELLWIHQRPGLLAGTQSQACGFRPRQIPAASRPGAERLHRRCAPRLHPRPGGAGIRLRQ